MNEGPVLIANRGEIAIRIARTCKALGFSTIGVYSEADRWSDHVRHCDFAFDIGGALPQESYLNIEKIIGVAKRAKARYVHPGYGFLSERPAFAEACQAAGLVFVGPTAESMRCMGDKVQARLTAAQLKVPLVPGSPDAAKNSGEAAQAARSIGYPILLKAAAGGGGKGMRRIDREADLASGFESASREAQAAFGDGSLYVEKLILEPHHVEIQVFGDGKGGAIHLGERECSIQRRHQKIWEETPAPALGKFPKTREAMIQSALTIASHVKYAGAGTVEFLADEAGKFYFLEMNTRLQVEHPVTEWVTGLDLVALQLELASGKPPELTHPERKGHAIEVRLCAEDPRSFLPAPGKVKRVEFPQGAFVRVDAAFRSEGEVSAHYDSMIAKISTWGRTREEAVNRLRVALDETRVLGEGNSFRTNLALLQRLSRHPAVLAGQTPTDLIPRNSELTSALGREGSFEAQVAAAIHTIQRQGNLPSPRLSGSGQMSTWEQSARIRGQR